MKARAAFEVKSEGDGFVVAFQSAGKALACASAIQKALVERNENAEEPVQVRMGLHAGEVIKEGQDFFGRNVIMAAAGSVTCAGRRDTGLRRAEGVAGADITWDMRTLSLKGLSGRARDLGRALELA